MLGLTTIKQLKLSLDICFLLASLAVNWNLFLKRLQDNNVTKILMCELENNIHARATIDFIECKDVESVVESSRQKREELKEAAEKRKEIRESRETEEPKRTEERSLAIESGHRPSTWWRQFYSISFNNLCVCVFEKALKFLSLNDQMDFPFVVNGVVVGKPNIRNGFGVRFTFTGTKKPSFCFSETMKTYADFHGNYWRGLPPGASSLASWMLPLRINFPDIDMFPNSEQASFSFVLGAKGLKHSLLLSSLRKLVRLGDPPIMIEILYSRRTEKKNILTQVVINPSALLRAFNADNSENIISPTPASSISRRTNGFWDMIRIMRWCLFPLLFLSMSWSLLYFPYHENPLVSYTPGLVNQVVHTNFTVDFHGTAPPYPQTLSQAWQIGYISSQIQQSTTHTQTESFLQLAADVLGNQKITQTNLDNIPKILQELEEARGIISRVVGFFTLINTIWLLAIIGISVSIGPSVYIMLKPLRRLLRQIIRKVYEKIVVPFVRNIHDRGILDCALWLIVFAIFVDSLSVKAVYVSYFVMLTSMGLAGPCFVYSTILFGMQVIKSLHVRTISHLINCYITLTVIPAAIYHQSTLLACVSLFSFYGILSFTVICTSCCYYSGLSSRDVMARIAVSSTMLMICYSIVKLLFGEQDSWLPFKLPIALAGPLALYFSVFIVASTHYYARLSYKKRQIPVILCLILGYLCSNFLFQHSGLYNATRLFFVLYLIEKGTDLHHKERYNPWLLVLFISLCAYFMALWFHNNPHFIVTMLKF